MKKHFHSLLTQILLTIAAAAVIFSPLPLARWHQLSETSQGGRGFMMLSFLAGFTLLVPFLAAPVGALLLLFPGKRRTGGSLLVCSIVFVITAIGVARLSKPIHHRAFQALAVRSEPLVGAIHQYAKAKGHPPAALSGLVPEYLPAVPGTGLPAYPNY